MRGAYTVTMRPLNPATLSPLLLQTIAEVVAQHGISMPQLAQGVAELSQLFTTDRGVIRQPYLDHPLKAAAYLSYFLPVNLAKVQVLLDEMPIPEPTGRLKVLDLGTGPGTGALAALDWWHRRNPQTVIPLEVIAVDHVRGALRQATDLWTRYVQVTGIPGATMRTVEGNLTRSANSQWVGEARHAAPYDLIVLANCLNELHVEAADSVAAGSALVSEVLAWLAPTGTMMIVEPALRETARTLQQIRDRLLQERRCTVYSPCLHENPCPALVNPFDWCHEERAWIPPASIQILDERVGFIKDALKFSYLLLRKDGKTIVERRPDVFRVVSELRAMKGEKRAWLCNEQGRQEVGRQDRLASPQNEAFDQWHRGAIVQIERIVRKIKGGKASALGRIEQDVSVEMVRSAER